MRSVFAVAIPARSDPRSGITRALLLEAVRAGWQAKLTTPPRNESPPVGEEDVPPLQNRETQGGGACNVHKRPEA